MPDQPAVHSDHCPKHTFADYLEPFCAGFIACREGLTDSDGEAFLRAAHEAYQASGGQRAKRTADLILKDDFPPELARILTDPYIVIDRDHEVVLADGRSLWEHMEEWRNAPSNTASAD